MPRHAQVLAVAAVVLLLSLQPQSAKAEDYYQVHPHSLAPCGCAPLPPSPSAPLPVSSAVPATADGFFFVFGNAGREPPVNPSLGRAARCWALIPSARTMTFARPTTCWRSSFTRTRIKVCACCVLASVALGRSAPSSNMQSVRTCTPRECKRVCTAHVFG